MLSSHCLLQPCTWRGSPQPSSSSSLFPLPSLRKKLLSVLALHAHAASCSADTNGMQGTTLPLPSGHLHHHSTLFSSCRHSRQLLSGTSMPIRPTLTNQSNKNTRCRVYNNSGGIIGIESSGANITNSSRRCKKKRARSSAAALPWAAVTSSAAVPAATTAVLTSAAPAWWSAHLPALITSIGVLIVSISAAAFLLCSIPALWAMIRVAYRTEVILQQVERELPETAALIRLSGLQVTDCVAEITGLGSDLSSGLRSTANMATMTGAGMRQSVQGLQVIGQQIRPALASQESHTRDALEAGLQQRAQLKYTKPFLSQVAASAASTTRKIQQMRLGFKAFNLGLAARAYMNRQAWRIMSEYNQQSEQYTSLEYNGSRGNVNDKWSRVKGELGPDDRQQEQRPSPPDVPPSRA